MADLPGAADLTFRAAFLAFAVLAAASAFGLPGAHAAPAEAGSVPPPAATSTASSATAVQAPAPTSDRSRDFFVLLTPALSGVFGLGGTWLALRFGYRNTRETLATTRATNEAAINQKANEAELQSIGVKLSTFYGPFVQRSGENALLVAEFHARREPGFRTLLALLEPGWLDGLPQADRTIVCELVANGLALRALIRDQAGMVDPEVRAYLARAGVHFTMLSLARHGSLGNDPARFARYVYPRQLDDVLALDMARLKRRVETLRLGPSAKHGPLETLVIPEHLALPEWPRPPGVGVGAAA